MKINVNNRHKNSSIASNIDNDSSKSVVMIIVGNWVDFTYSSE